MTRVLIPLAEGFEEMEAVTLADILRRAEISVILAGLQPGPVRGAQQTLLLPDSTLDEILNDDFDAIVLPGGQPGVDNLKTDSRIIALLKRMSAERKVAAAICAAPMVLAEAGLLTGKKATAYPGTLETMKIKEFVFEESAVVEDGLIITSRGPGTSVEFALALVTRLKGLNLRKKVEAALCRMNA